MTIKQLIEELQEFDQDQEIYVVDPSKAITYGNEVAYVGLRDVISFYGNDLHDVPVIFAGTQVGNFVKHEELEEEDY